MKNEHLLEVAKLGKTVGLRGDLKLHLLCDFPEQFRVGESFLTKKFGELSISNFDAKRFLVRFKDYEDATKAKPLTNTLLLSTVEKTRQVCKLGKDEFFWFDIIGLDVCENEQKLGTVERIERIANQDYLSVKTHEELSLKGLAKTFLIPYVPRYIKSVSLEQKSIETVDALELLKAS